MAISPEKKIEFSIKVKEYNNKFFAEKIADSQKQIKILQEDCIRLEALIATNNEAIKELQK
jgi:hypothetical protein